MVQPALSAFFSLNLLLKYFEKYRLICTLKQVAPNQYIAHNRYIAHNLYFSKDT